MAKETESTGILTVMMVDEKDGESLRGKRIAATGHLGLPRAEIARLIAANGGVFHDSIKWDTSHLVTNRQWNRGSTTTPTKSKKILDAEARGIRIITEAQLVELFFRK